MGVRFDARVHAQHDAAGVARAECGEPLELEDVIDDARGEASVDDGAQLLVGLAATVQVHARRREAGAFGDVEIAERTDVERERRLRESLDEFDEE